MAYEKQTWTTGEVITQEKLNHMEDGIANAGKSSLITITTDDFLACADDNDTIDTYDVLVSAIRKNPYTAGAAQATTLIHIPDDGKFWFQFYKGSGDTVTEISMGLNLLFVCAYAKGDNIQTADLGFGVIFSLGEGRIISVEGRTPAASVASCSYSSAYYNGKYYTLIGLLGATADKVSYNESTR